MALAARHLSTTGKTRSQLQKTNGDKFGNAELATARILESPKCLARHPVQENIRDNQFFWKSSRKLTPVFAKKMTPGNFHRGPRLGPPVPSISML